MKLMTVKPYEICDAIQTFLSISQSFESFLNTKGMSVKKGNIHTPINFIHYPKQQTAISTFPFISLESNENLDLRTNEDGFRWYVDIVIGLKDITEDNPDHQVSVNENIKKFTKTRDVQDMATEILLAIKEELEITGIKGDFEIIFGKIQQSSTPTGEFDGMYHLIELELVSYKEI